MIKCLRNISFTLLLMVCQSVFAGSGLLFDITATGTPDNVSITLCLNGKGPVSCQYYTVRALTLSILSTIHNHIYQFAGIKINTPGYTIENLGVDCTTVSNGYCLFSVSDTTAKTISIVVSSTDYQASNSCGTYNFVDINTTGQFVTSGDDVENNVTLETGHPVIIYGVPYTALRLSTNGVISTDLSDHIPCCPNTCLPASATGNRFDPLWDDLTVSGGVYYQYFSICPRISSFQSGEGCHVFEWYGADYYPVFSATFNFETIIYDVSGAVIYQYGPNNPQTGQSATFGVQNQSGSSFVQFGCNTAGVISANSLLCLVKG